MAHVIMTMKSIASQPILEISHTGATTPTTCSRCGIDSSSGTDGWAETTWQTQAPNRKGAGGTTPGAYAATVSNVTASGYVWDGVATARSFALE